MIKDFDIDALMAPTWLTVAQLRHGGKVTDGPALYATCKAQVESVPAAKSYRSGRNGLRGCG